MTGVDLNRIGGKTQGWHIVPDNAQGLVDAFNAAARLGCECICRAYPLAPDPASPGLYVVNWSLSLTPRGEVTKTGGVGDWIVYETGTARLYHWPDMPSTFTTSQVPLEWAALSTPPHLDARPGLVARLTFPQPTSPNGPFNYTFLGGAAGGNLGPITSTSDTPEVHDNGDLFVEFAGLTADTQYQAAVTVTTPYPDISATSPPSNTMTAQA